MGKKLDALLGRSSRPSRLRTLLNLAFARLTVLKNQRQARGSLARSDVVHLLSLGQHDRALLRVEHVIKEQNMIDVFTMIDSYCDVVIERIDLIQEKECPEELKEAAASLVFASSRTGEFPELQEIREVFAACFGKEFVARSIDLRNSCGVNIKMIQKLSTRPPSLETRMTALQEIADENGIKLTLGEAAEEKHDKQKRNQLEQQISDNANDGFECPVGGINRKYKDVADAAQAAFQSAANAAEAAKAAVELSRCRPPDSDNHDSRGVQRKESHQNEEETIALSMKALEDDVASSTAHEDVRQVSDGEESELKNLVTQSEKGSWEQNVEEPDDRKGPISVRTRR